MSAVERCARAAGRIALVVLFAIGAEGVHDHAVRHDVARAAAIRVEADRIAAEADRLESELPGR
jgi:hypothetical protein